MVTYLRIPCRKLRVGVHYSDAAGLSVVEQVFLRCVAAGADSIAAVEDTLGLHGRMILGRSRP